MDNPAPDNDASVKSLGIFLFTKVNNNNMYISILNSIIKGKIKSKLKKGGTNYTCISILFNIHTIYILYGGVCVDKIHKIIEKITTNNF
jgi:hypothetical protein